MGLRIYWLKQNQKKSNFLVKIFLESNEKPVKLILVAVYSFF